MTFKKTARIIAFIFLAMGIIVSVYCAWQRLDIERANKKTALLIDYHQLTEACALEGVSLNDALLRFAPYATGVVIKEPTLSDLENSNLMMVKSGIELKAHTDKWLEDQGIDGSDIRSDYYYLFFADKEELLRVEEHIKAKAPLVYCDVLSGNGQILATSLPYAVFSNLGIGFPEGELNAIEEAGLKTVVQIRDSKYPFSTAAIDAEIDDLKDHDILAVGFNDTSVPGANLKAADWGKLKNYWVDSIAELDVPIFTIEFYSQKGLNSLALAMDDHILRMHAISEQEMIASLTEAKAIERLQLAASERNMKLLLVRFLPFSNLDQNVDYFKNISQAMWQKEIVVTAPAAAAPLLPDPVLLFLIALAVLAGAWLLALFFRIPFWLDTLGLVLGALFALGLLFTGRVELMQRAFALLSVLVFPTLAVIYLTPDKSPGFWKAVGRLIETSAVSLLGALFMVGLMADSDFMLKLLSFSGVKAAHVFPIALLLVWFLFIKEKGMPAKEELNLLLEKPLTVKYLIAAFVICAILAVYIMRTGNEAVSVSELERTFRSFLDNLLVVRPRTKEFLLGYPLLLFSFYYGYSKKILPVLLLGSIGVISSVNTFAHIHTPLLISLLRTFNGLILGIIAGAALIFLSRLILRLWQKTN